MRTFQCLLFVCAGAVVVVVAGRAQTPQTSIKQGVYELKVTAVEGATNVSRSALFTVEK